MAVSVAFDEFAEVLKHLEGSDVGVENVSFTEDVPAESERLSADLRLSVPVFPGLSFRDTVSILDDETDLTEERLTLDVTVSVPNDGTETTPVSASETGRVSEAIASSDRGVPLYQDPEALRSVYEEYDSFTEMTEALGVDVTSETVRRYMVEFDIHDPNEDTASGVREERTDGESSEATTSRSPDAGTSAMASASAGDETGDLDLSSGSERHADRRQNGETATDTETPSSDGRDLGQVSIADAVATARKHDEASVHAADGLGLPRNLTMAEFVSIIESARTPHEVKRALDMSHDDCRRLLDDLNLLEFVHCRISATQANVSPTVICRRLGIDPGDL